MPHLHAASKYVRTSKRNATKNALILGPMRTAVKDVRSAITAGKIDDARKAFTTAVSKLDRAARKGIIKKNTAARTKSRLSRAISAKAKA